ncbi:glycosyltransferase family 2 protein [Sphingobacterium nematocida]|uniref:glycosyltransferase family 2 protein n=1 Tax=Sphingobacterium nematocida TaxID=1513896 RepID=UPI0009A719B2|nr:glycosyltransferase family 2 protein [Sphingobacterium nematocida]
MSKKCSLIISTYNWPEALNLCLQSVLEQTVLPDEIIIADDGSKPETRDLINYFISRSSIPIQHIWHEDRGFRLASIRNKSFARTTGDYIIQIDGDIILHRDFVKDHLLFARTGYLLQGSRVMLGQTYSQRLLSNSSVKINIYNLDIKRRENGFRLLPIAKYLINKYRNRYPVYFARGANMSFWKKDLLAVNGYDEMFEGWGHEDSDLTLRLMNNGIKKSVIKFAAIAYHIYHPERKSLEIESKNKLILEQTLLSKTTWTKVGLDQHLD